MSELWITGARDPVGGGPASLLIRDGEVADEAPRRGARRLDAQRLWLAPGFIDLQLNGAFGRDFAADPSTIWEVGEELARTGVTGFLPTLVSSSEDAYAAALDAWRSPSAGRRSAQPLGWHFEGPMLSPARAGAHDPANLRLPSEVDLLPWTAAAGVRMVTIAPDLPGALAAIGRLDAGGVVVAAGHSDADADCGRLAIEAGVRYATHLFNAMRGFDTRQPGVAMALLRDERVTVGLIADGQHLAEETLDLVWRAAGPGRVSLVTDGIAALGRPPGRYRLGEVEVAVSEQAGARTADGRLAGSVATLPAMLRALRDATGCSLAEALATVTEAPARLLRLPDRGHLRPGARGDAVLLDDALQVQATIVNGDVAFAAEALGWA